jgi:hypothetical protein
MEAPRPANEVQSPYETDDDDDDDDTLAPLRERRRRKKRTSPGPLANARLRRPDGGGALQQPYSQFHHAVSKATGHMYKQLMDRTLEAMRPYRELLAKRANVNNPAAPAAFEQYCKALHTATKAIEAIDVGMLKMLQWHRDNATVPDTASTLTADDIAATIARNERILAIRFTRL